MPLGEVVKVIWKIVVVVSSSVLSVLSLVLVWLLGSVFSFPPFFLVLLFLTLLKFILSKKSE